MRLECWLFNTGELARHCKRTNPMSLHSEELMDLPFLIPGCLTRLTWRIRGAAVGRTRRLCKVKRWWACPSPHSFYMQERYYAVLGAVLYCGSRAVLHHTGAFLHCGSGTAAYYVVSFRNGTQFQHIKALCVRWAKLCTLRLNVKVLLA